MPNLVAHLPSLKMPKVPRLSLPQHAQNPGVSGQQVAQAVPNATALEVENSNNSVADGQLPSHDTVTTVTAVATSSDMIQVDAELLPEIEEWADRKDWEVADTANWFISGGLRYLNYLIRQQKQQQSQSEEDYESYEYQEEDDLEEVL